MFNNYKKRAASPYRGRGIYTGKGKYARKRMYSGRGSYTKKVAKFAGKVHRYGSPAASIAAQAATAYGNPQASFAINSAMQGAKMLGGKYAGWGMYTGRGSYANDTKSNILLDGGGQKGNGVPSFQSTGDETGALVITHSEYITDVYGLPDDVEFKSTSYSINPGLNRMFPYLSQIAANFEEYEILQMAVTYKPKINPNLQSTSGQLGSVILFTDYNPDDEKKESKQQMIQGYGNTNGRITDDLLHFIECDPSKLKGDGHRFIRVRPPLSSSGRLMDYDHGKFQVAVSGTPSSIANQTLGELYVSYAVKLLKPRIYTMYGLGLDTDYYLSKSDGVVLGATTNSINCIFKKNDDGKIELTFPSNVSGHFHVEILIETSVSTTENDHLVPVLLGQVTKSYMLPYYNENMRWNRTSIVRSLTTTPDDENHLAKIEATVNIEQATSGVDNQMTFSWNGSSWFEDQLNAKITRINDFELAQRPITFADPGTGDIIVSTRHDS